MRATLAATSAAVREDDKKSIPFPSPHRIDPGAPRDPSEASSDVKVRSYPREYAYRVSVILLVGDLVFACLSVYLGLIARQWQRIGMGLAVPSDVAAAKLIPMCAVGGGILFVWLMILLRTYEVANLYKMRRWTNNLFVAVTLWSIGAWALVGLFQITNFSPRVGVVYCAVITVVLMMLWRLGAFVFLMQPAQREAVSSRIIVVGWNDKAAHLRASMRSDLAQLSEIIGCVPLPDGRFAVPPPPEVANLGSYGSLPSLALECKAHTIILADSSSPSREIQSLAAFCQREMIGFKMIPEYFPALSSGLQVQTVSGVPLLSVSQLPLDSTGNRLLKRFVDLVGGSIGMLISAPIIVLFGFIVYLESRGPIIYRQRRTSRGGRDFFIYKIRSMRMDAESKSGAVWSTHDDPRRLKVGAFMRKYNVDELPQFWNVLKGDMSLVGPRPERPELIEKFKGEIPNYNARHEVRAGLTGWAQVNGLRGNTDLTKRIEADLHYLENWSLMLDFYCMVGTVFNNKNAH